MLPAMLSPFLGGSLCGKHSSLSVSWNMACLPSQEGWFHVGCFSSWLIEPQWAFLLSLELRLPWLPTREGPLKRSNKEILSKKRHSQIQCGLLCREPFFFRTPFVDSKEEAIWVPQKLVAETAAPVLSNLVSQRQGAWVLRWLSSRRGERLEPVSPLPGNDDPVLKWHQFNLFLLGGIPTEKDHPQTGSRSFSAAVTGKLTTSQCVLRWQPNRRGWYVPAGGLRYWRVCSGGQAGTGQLATFFCKGQAAI